MPHVTDLNLTPRDLQGLTSADALAAFFATLGYDTSRRKNLSAESIGLAGDSASPIKAIEFLADDADGFLRIVFVHLRSLTAKSRNDLARVLSRSTVDHLLVLASDFEVLEFVLLDKRRRESRGPVDQQRIQVVPLSVAVPRKSVTSRQLRIIRRFTWTSRDGLEQFDKLRSVFEAAAFSEDYFCNRALFADHFLLTRLREDPAWRENPTEAFQQVKQLLAGAQQKWREKGEEVVRKDLYETLFKLLGFQATVNKDVGETHAKPDYLLAGLGGKTAAFVYTWDRWLDGPDFNLDQQTSDENPGACVVTALEEGIADWIIVTNGRTWRLYSRHAHSRATNFYEVDLAEALIASGDTDPNEAFRYWWLFFRSQAFAPAGDDEQTCWLDAVAQGSREYAKEIGERLKDRIFKTIFPHLAQGFLEDRKRRLGIRRAPTEEELHDLFEATLTLLYRLLFLLYAESRDLLPIREAAYHTASLSKIKQEIADKGGIAETEVSDRIDKAFSAGETMLYDRLVRLCAAMDRGDPTLNVPIYNGGLFISRPDESGAREQRIAKFLAERKVPDRHLALAIDRLARDPDDKTYSLVFIDYKSLEVRHLGSIYEGLLEFKLQVADEDLTTKTEKGSEKFIPLSAAKAKKGKAADVVVQKGAVYLSNDKAERKASGSYYTPDPIVEYIVAQTVGPVLAEKLDALRADLRKVRKTYDNELAKLKVPPIPTEVKLGEQTPQQFAGEKTYLAHRQLVDSIFDFRTLDPAMGSGHFLVESVDFITDRLLTFLNQFPVNPVTFMLERTRRNILAALGEQGVAVDPAKLTEVNLLKRHVLKRCIYGVDLNPMAVELAKVSLWLDAFTIGAPLSFLDHHLRCGNSLIGATFKDLEAATKGKLFSIDYEPLLRAIRHVIQVNQMADATAAEVKQSASEYKAARHDLSGYQIVLDLLVARHFGLPNAAGLLEFGKDLDLASRDHLMKSLRTAAPTRKGETPPDRMVDQVSELALRPDLRFFHWEIEFPEVFFGTSDSDQRLIQHKTEIEAGTAGFNVIIGNPPYVRQEALKPLKEYLKATYRTFDSTNDLYVFFQEREISNLCSTGRMAMIVANKWMRAGYGQRLRHFLRRIARPIEVIDFGHSPIFPDADTFPCILVAAIRPKPLVEGEPLPSHEEMGVAIVPRERWSDRMDLVHFVSSCRYRIPTTLLRDECWSLEDPRVQKLLEKIRNTGMPLRQYIGSEIFRGVLTGCNNAFYLDQDVRDRLLAVEPASRDLIKPQLRGQDVGRWQPANSFSYLLFVRRGTDIKQYPHVLRHLTSYRQELEPKPRSWDDEVDGKWPGRKPGPYAWYEIQDVTSYYRLFEQPKIIVQCIGYHSRWCLDTSGYYVNNKTFFLPTADTTLLAFLNSPLLWWYMWRTFPHMKDEALSIDGQCVEELPIPTLSQGQSCEIRVLVDRLLELTGRLRSSEQQAEDKNLRFSNQFEPYPILAEQLELERKLAALVEDAYGLTNEERLLLRKTRPVRDPIDVLEAKLAGNAVLHEASETEEGENQ